MNQNEKKGLDSRDMHNRVLKKNSEYYCTNNFKKCHDQNNTINNFNENAQFQEYNILNNKILNYTINPNFTCEEMNIIHYILEEAENKNIKLKVFKRIISEEPPSGGERIALNKAISILKNLIDEGRLPIYSKIDEIVSPYKEILGDYINKDHPEFEFYTNQTNKKYVQIIYEIIALFGMGTTTDTYIGHTAFNKKERMIAHLRESLKLFVEIYELKTQNSIIDWLDVKKDSPLKSVDYYPPRFILKTFLEGLKRLKGFNSIKELYTFSRGIISAKNDSTIQAECEEIVNELLENKLIAMNILEVHFSTKFVYENENWYKLPQNYKKKGTVYPEGLNMHNNIEGKSDYRMIPLYDTSFLISIGYKPPIIVGILNEVYGEDFNEVLIRTRLNESFNNSHYKELLKCVFEEVLEKKLTLNRKLITKAINRGQDFFFSDEFKQWYGESVSLKELKKVLRSKKIHNEEFNWDNIQKEINDYYENKLIKGIPKSQWISWFIDKRIGMDDIGEKAGYSDGRSFSNHFWKLNRVQEIFGVSSMREAVVKYRRKRVIKELKKGQTISINTLERIFVDIFGYRTKQNYYKSSYYWAIMSRVFREIFPEFDNNDNLSPKQYLQDLVFKISLGEFK
ncbi:MAG: hypothetical protein ACFFCE_04380 [Promethearchaeota archaeon]